MLQTHPQPMSADRDTLVRCIEACFSCAAVCTGCADACLGEQNVPELARCIRLNHDCADICDAAGRMLARQIGADAAVPTHCCRGLWPGVPIRGDECERHAEHHDHCRVCADACRRCEQACNDLLATVG